MDTAFGLTSVPACTSVATENHILFDNENEVSNSSLSSSHGCGLFHSSGEKRADIINIKLMAKVAANV